MLEDNAAMTGAGDGVWSALRRWRSLPELSSMRYHMRYQKSLQACAKRENDKGLPKKAFVFNSLRWFVCGSPTWTRTRDLRINSPSLYRLSYQGTASNYSAVFLRFWNRVQFVKNLWRDIGHNTF